MSSRERDSVLSPNEFAFIGDQTKGNINVYVGPYKTSLANTDKPVIFNARTKRFEPCSLEKSTQIFPTAPEGWYVVIKNPASNGQQPKTGTVSNLGELDVGKKVNIPGPVTFALWPGQMGRIVQGHQLRSNQYLLVRVYDEEAALASWGEAVIKPQSGEGEPAVAEDPELPATAAPPALPVLIMGKQLIIKGTEISFYIPPTGVEVVRDPQGRYVREAVTLERLEYCILLDESGQKRYIQGPDVVFPEPTETFVSRGARKHRAVELNENSGLYIKVIAPYTEGDRSYTVGEELFITGNEQMIYFPRPEHAVVRYGEQEIHYAVAIPKGEGRYCMDRLTGQIRLVRGPAMFLPDPRKEVIVKRVLSPKQVSGWFPGNDEAMAYNLRLKEMAEDGELEEQDDVDVLELFEAEEATSELAGDDFRRSTRFTPPRTITLDTKYEGAVTISIWTGYAVLVVSRSGERRVIVGPQTTLLEYDETLEAMELSTGRPKSDANLMKTVYLRSLHNKVSDVMRAETRDLVRVQIELSYRVNFEGEPERWFNVENYVKFLTDHMRSLIRNAVKQVGIQEFHAGAIAFLRDTVLGQAGEKASRRAGRTFEENGMRIYDVEVLDIRIGDKHIEKMLIDAQHAAVSQTLAIAAERRELETVTQREAIRRQIAQEQATTAKAALGLKQDEIALKLGVRLAEIDANVKAQDATLTANQAQQEAMTAIQAAELTRSRASSDQELAVEKERLEQRLSELRAEVSAVTEKAGAVSPDLIAALQAFSDQALVERVAESMAPLAILGGDSVADVLSRLLKGTALERVIQQLPKPPSEQG